MAAQHGRDDLSVPLVGNMLQVQAVLFGQARQDNMVCRSHAHGAINHFAGILLGILDKILQRVPGRVGLDIQGIFIGLDDADMGHIL